MTDDYAELLSLAVHEFRTPASVVSGYLRMLLKGSDPLSEQQRKMLSEADKSCARFMELVAELSDIAKLDRDTVELKKDSFDLFPMLAELATSVHEARDREVYLQIRGDGANAQFAGDLSRIQAAFTAFFRAILREQPSATVVVADRRRVTEGGSVSAVIVIAPERDVLKAYESQPAPFIEKRGGMGLSLPIGRRVIERHGGRVWSPIYESKASSNAIVVSLPIKEPSR